MRNGRRRSSICQQIVDSVEGENPEGFLQIGRVERNAGAVCTRAELLSEVWGYAFDPGSNVVDVTIARLRAKIEGLRIETVRNVGYALKHA